MKKNFSLEAFKAMTSKTNVDSTDYLHAIFQSMNLPIDILICFSKFFYPSFSIIDNRVFLSESLNLDNYNKAIKTGSSHAEVQFWSNLTEITGIFETIKLDDAEKVALIIVNTWNQKINNEYSNVKSRARVIIEKDLDEVFVTIDEHK